MFVYLKLDMNFGNTVCVCLSRSHINQRVNGGLYINEIQNVLE